MDDPGPWLELDSVSVRSQNVRVTVLEDQAPSAGEKTAAPPGDSAVLLDGGAQAFDHMLRAISHARRSVELEIYTFRVDAVGERFLEALCAAAVRGVKVRVTVDGWGSASDGDDIAEALEAVGVDVHIYNRLLAIFTGRLKRNHRKILVVDDAIAFVGGINLDARYAGTLDTPAWADIALELSGPCCAYLGAKLRHEPTAAGTPGHPASQHAVQIHLSGGGRRLRKRYLKAISSARHGIDLAHGYFLPDRRMIRALRKAARRGVQVRLLVPGTSDVPLVHAATQRLYRYLLPSGVRIHEWTSSVLHAKVALVDGAHVLTGSFNLDPLSLANQEVLVEVRDPALGRQVQEWLLRHYAAAVPVTAQGPVARGRLASWITWIGSSAYRFARALAGLLVRR